MRDCQRGSTSLFHATQAEISRKWQGLAKDRNSCRFYCERRPRACINSSDWPSVEEERNGALGLESSFEPLAAGKLPELAYLEVPGTFGT